MRLRAPETTATTVALDLSQFSRCLRVRNRRWQARDGFRLPLDHLGICRCVALGNQLLDDLDRALDLLGSHRLDPAGVLEFQLFRDEHGADLQVARRALPPNPLEHLAPTARRYLANAVMARSSRL